MRGKHAWRIELLQAVENPRHLHRRASQTFRHLRDVGMQVAGFVELVDQVLGDQKVGGAVDAEGNLLVEKIAQRHAVGDEIVEVISLAALAFAAAGHGLPLAEQFRRIGALRRGVVWKDILEIGVELFAHPFAGRRGRAVIDVTQRIECRTVGIVPVAAIVLGDMQIVLAMPVDSSRRIVIGGEFKQGVLLDFQLDELVQFKMRHLQQLDRLHQLRRHGQSLALTQEEAG